MLASLATIAVVLAEQAKGGLPQLNPHDFAPQLIWLAITFGLLMFLLTKVALPRVGGVIEERAQRVARDFSEAERLKLEAEKALSDYETSLAAARSRAGGIAKEIRDKLAADVDAERAKVETQVNGRIEDAERRIAEMKARAMAEVGQIATETTEAIVTQLTGKSVSPVEISAAVKASTGS
jgi:F-type H+-transporting ATPase subunit b